MYLLAIALVINTITSTYSAAFYPPDFFLKGPASQATIYGPDGSKIVSEADAGSISSKGIVGPTFKASTVVGNGQSSQNCGACGSDSVNSNSSPDGNKVLIQGPSMTSSISGPTNAADVSGSSSSAQEYYASLPNNQDQNKVGDSEKSADCDHQKSATSGEFQGSNFKNAYLPPIDSSKQLSSPHSGNDGVYNGYVQHSNVDIQGPSAHSTITGPHDTAEISSIPKPLSPVTSSNPHYFNNGQNADSNPGHSVVNSASPHAGNQDSTVHSANPSPSNSNYGEYPEFSSIKSTFIQPDQPLISPDYSHTASFPSNHDSSKSLHTSWNPNGYNQNTDGSGVVVQNPSAYPPVTSSENNAGLTQSSQNSEVTHGHTPNYNGGSESSLHPDSVTVQDLGVSGDNKPSYSSHPSGATSYNGHDYYDSSSFAPPTYMKPDTASGNNLGNLRLDSFDNGASGNNYDCYILRLPLNTYAYILPTDDSAFLKKLVQSVPGKPQIFYVHKSHHHHPHSHHDNNY